LAHDLRGWLTPVSTCLQLYGAGPQGEKKAAQLRPEALKSLDAVQACLEQARYFSKHHALKIQPVRLPGILDKALDLLKSALTSKRLRVSVRAGDNLQAQVDEVLILRLLDNLLTNAIRATPAGSDIHVSIERTGSSAHRPEEIVLRITNSTAEGPAESPDASPALRETADAAPRDDLPRDCPVARGRARHDHQRQSSRHHRPGDAARPRLAPVSPPRGTERGGESATSLAGLRVPQTPASAG
jgi:hypothetical protein